MKPYISQRKKREVKWRTSIFGAVFYLLDNFWQPDITVYRLIFSAVFGWLFGWVLGWLILKIPFFARRYAEEDMKERSRDGVIDIPPDK